MADFRTHVLGAALASGGAATSLMLVGAADRQSVIGYFVLGVVGGMLPDIDSKSSVPVRIAFNVLAVTAGFLMVFAFAHRYSLLELLILGGTSFMLVRHGVFTLFSRCTVHRGLIHSVPAGAAFGLIATLLSHHFFGASALTAWFCGLFVFMGFIVHLLLDEAYSVNLMGLKLKKSFGTAFSFGSIKNWGGTLLLYLLVLILWQSSPSMAPVKQVLASAQTYQTLAQRLVPSQGWFQGLLSSMLPPPPPPTKQP